VEVFTSNYWTLIDLRSVLLDTRFDIAHVLQAQVPAALKFRGDQSVLWIGRIVLPEGAVDEIPGKVWREQLGMAKAKTPTRSR